MPARNAPMIAAESKQGVDSQASPRHSASTIISSECAA
ncbi:hypothetical protein RLIN73S_04142 [Rhodanobacter lindaniclasticus]